MRLRPGVPVLLREPGHTQVGLVRPLAFPGLRPEEGAFLASLEGRRVSFSRAERERFRPIVAALRAHGLLEDPRVEEGASTLVRLRGVDAISTALAVGLALGGVSALSLVGPGRTRPGGLPSQGRGDAATIARLVKDSEPTVRLAGPDERATLEVIRAHGAPDICLVRSLTSGDIPHLGIVTDEDGISIGPLIVPGVTPCELCLGISRGEGDPWWPRLALQLGDSQRNAGLVVPPEAALLAAGVALREALGFLRGGAPTSRRWRVPFQGETIETEVCTAHPACGCGAAPPSDGQPVGLVAAPVYRSRAPVP